MVGDHFDRTPRKEPDVRLYVFVLHAVLCLCSDVHAGSERLQMTQNRIPDGLRSGPQRVLALGPEEPGRFSRSSFKRGHQGPFLVPVFPFLPLRHFRIVYLPLPMAADICLAGLPPALMGVQVREELGSIPYLQTLTEGTRAQQPASLPDASGAATREPLQPDTYLYLRPPTNRLASVGPSQEGNVQDENDISNNDAAATISPHPVVGTYPPPPHTLALLELALESKGLRRLRMASAFLTLFLAGWKLVQVPDLPMYCVKSRPRRSR